MSWPILRFTSLFNAPTASETVGARPWAPRRPAFDPKDHVDMIGHDHIFVNTKTAYEIRGQDILLHDFPCIRQLKMRAAEGVGPYGEV